MKDKVDYSLYLVTDSTPAILGSRDLVEVVEQALQGGVTIVQYRDKTSDTGALISTAKALHEKCKTYNIPLLINDRVDVALAVGCEGVHLGQDDMNIAEARTILGPNKIIGATVSSVEEANVAVERGADYLGIGTLYATNTKKNTKDIIGVNGTRKILRYLDEAGEAAQKVKTVCIGGVHSSNTARVFFQLSSPTPGNQQPKHIDGVAVVSAIVGAADPITASKAILAQVKSPAPWLRNSTGPFFWLEKNCDEISHLLAKSAEATANVMKTGPLSHNMTNLVVQNFAANVALALGASPIMANYAAEAPDLAALGGALVVNMGTVTPDGLENYLQAVTAYNLAGGPVVLDPVGAGATSVRRAALAKLLSNGHFDLIKGNEREILAVARACGFGLSDTSQQRGVDSGDALLSLAQRADVVSRVAARQRTVVVMTGATDVLSDGLRTYAVSNGHEYLGLITGSGCTLGTTLSAYLAANKGDKLYAAVAGLLHFEIAAEYAAKREDVKGPGTFVPAFIDELYRRSVEVAEGRAGWEVSAKVECMKEISDSGLLREG